MVEREAAPSDRTGSVQALIEMSRLLLSDFSFDEVLARAAQTAQRAIPGAAEVSITMQGRGPATVASTGAMASTSDETQYTHQEGPCLDAMWRDQTVVVDDLEAEARWPAYRPAALAAGVRSSLSVPVAVDGRPVGAYNCYAREPGTFDVDSVDVGEQIAGYVSVVLANAALYYTAATRADSMEEAMRSRAVIEQAKGILMGARHCDADEAFGILVAMSQRSHQKLHEVAGRYVAQSIDPQ